ncbi:MAG: hypothetical protein U5K51_15935 [Flavobacteriaceae bacterium]|nr:hypothetical protein [Flavobacteriaceae bacterium]
MEDPFLYNKSGIELAYGGDIIVKESSNRFMGADNAANNKTFSESNLFF